MNLSTEEVRSAMPGMPESHSLVDEILGELRPILARQRQSMVRHGCLRAVSSGHLHLLMVLDNEGTMPMSRLAEHLDASLPNLTGIVGRMEERGLLERVRDTDDRRVVNVRITEAGRTTMHEMELLKLRNFQLLLEHLPAPKQAVCLEAFKAMREAAAEIDAAGGLDTLDHHHPHGADHGHLHAGRPAGHRPTTHPIPTTLV
jgi:DNA-binding MarR family transcriptional regulator